MEITDKVAESLSLTAVLFCRYLPIHQWQIKQHLNLVGEEKE